MTFRIPKHISDYNIRLFPARNANGASFLIPAEARTSYLKDISAGKTAELKYEISEKQKPYYIMYVNNRCIAISNITFSDAYSNTEWGQDLETGEFVEINVINKSRFNHAHDVATKFYKEALLTTQSLDSDRYCVITPFNYGFTFRRHIHDNESDKRRPQHAHEKVDMALELIYAVKKLHDQNLVHNDIKSQTCLYDSKAGTGNRVSFSELYTVRSDGANFSVDDNTIDEYILKGAPHRDPSLERNTKASDCYSVGVLISRIFHRGKFNDPNDVENGIKIEREKLQESNTDRPWLFEARIEKIIREEVINNLANPNAEKRDLEKAKIALEALKKEFAYDYNAVLSAKTVNWRLAAPLLLLGSAATRMMFLPVGEKPGFEAFCEAVRDPNGDDFSGYVDKLAGDISFCAAVFVIAAVGFACYSYYQTQSYAETETKKPFRFSVTAGQNTNTPASTQPSNQIMRIPRIS